jgi:hypothetical protein
MRILCGITIAVVLAVGAWSTFPTQAKQINSISTDYSAGMKAATSAPVTASLATGLVPEPEEMKEPRPVTTRPH